MKIGLIEQLKAKDPRAWYRVSVAAFYFVQGLVFASWASRIPDIKNALGMNEAMLGGVLFFIPAGQMTAMALSGYLVSKYGSRKMLVIGATLYPLALIGLGAAASILQLSIGLFFFGMAANLCNISVNTQAVGVERLYGRSIMASFHGLWSLAGFFGGVISTFMVAVDLSPLHHFSIIFLFAMLMVLTMHKTILPRDEQQDKGGSYGQKESKKIFTTPDRFVLILGLLAFGSMVCEGTMFDWSSVYFEDVVNPPKNLIRLGYIASMSSMALGRFTADRYITKYGEVKVLMVSGVIIAVGLLVATIFPTLTLATIGFLLVGLGVSSIVPISYSLAGKSKKMLPGVAIATVSSVGFFGFLLGPPVIGFIAHGLNLRWSLGLIAIVGIFITAVAPQLRREIIKNESLNRN